MLRFFKVRVHCSWSSFLAFNRKQGPKTLVSQKLVALENLHDRRARAHSPPSEFSTSRIFRAQILAAYTAPNITAASWKRVERCEKEFQKRKPWLQRLPILGSQRLIEHSEERRLSAELHRVQVDRCWHVLGEIVRGLLAIFLGHPRVAIKTCEQVRNALKGFLQRYEGFVLVARDRSQETAHVVLFLSVTLL